MNMQIYFLYGTGPAFPGVTAPQMNKIPMAQSSWQTRGTSTFAGGVSDSIYGASAYSYRDDYADINTKAKKAWFFFDEEVVCLGAGISSTSPEDIFTTVNQSLLSQKKSYSSQEVKPHMWNRILLNI